MRYLDEDPWERVEKIKVALGDKTRLAALCRGRNLFGYNPYPDEVVKMLCNNAAAAGIDIMRIFDAMNDTANMAAAIKYTDRTGAIADGAVCYAIDPHHSAVERIEAALHGHPLHKPVFTDDYFLEKARHLECLGASIVTLEDDNGLITPPAHGRPDTSVEEEPQSTCRLPYPLYGRLWAGFDLICYRKRRGYSGYLHVVLCPRYLCPGSRASLRLLQEDGYRTRYRYGSGSRYQRRASPDTPGAGSL